MALRGVGIGAKENQLGAVITEYDGIASKINVNLSGKLNNVLTENVSLRFTGREENLIISGI
ncbi:Uncharacterised protein [Acinetobacter baumannii]|nr:Uncharacterised protein [Acinetobacter baumannii]